MVTPFTKGGQYVDFEKIGPIAQYLVKGGAHGLFPCGTTGEGLLLSTEERKEVLKEVVLEVGKKAQIIAHTGAIETATTIELTRHAQEAGAHAAAIVAPFYYSYDNDALYKYFVDIAKAVPKFPILVYNIPGCAKNVLSADLIIRLGNEVENIVGCKDSSGNMIHLTRLLGNAPKGFQVINGADEYGFQAFVAGAPAAVSGTSNVVLKLYKSVWDHLQKKDLKKAWQAQVVLEEACRIFAYGGSIAMFKEGMRLQGIDAGYVRGPMRELTKEEKATVKKNLQKLGIIK
jgi:dihydrodipicolinate synthase/N-acetylneuraminate lyase